MALFSLVVNFLKILSIFESLVFNTNKPISPCNISISPENIRKPENLTVLFSGGIDNTYKEPSIDLETNTKSNKHLDKIRNQQNKNVTEKLDPDNINEKNKKREYRLENNTKKRKRTRKIKEIWQEN